jgi:hypothetical protein
MTSIVWNEKKCFLCGSSQWLEKHHIFGGANRKKSEKYGLTVYLCHYCHNEPPNGVHHNASNMLLLKKIGQDAFQKHFPDKDFLKEFGKNYL